MQIGEKGDPLLLCRWRGELAALSHTPAMQWVFRLVRWETYPGPALENLLRYQQEIPEEHRAQVHGAARRLRSYLTPE